MNTISVKETILAKKVVADLSTKVDAIHARVTKERGIHHVVPSGLECLEHLGRVVRVSHRTMSMVKNSTSSGFPYFVDNSLPDGVIIVDVYGKVDLEDLTINITFNLI